MRIDLHVHTSCSLCALLPPAQLLRLARRRGLDAVAITDHNTIRGALQVAARANDLQVIIGEEIKTSQGEIIGYFLHEEIPAGLTPEATITAIRRQQGVVSVPHPFDTLRSSRLDPTALERILPQVDMLEIDNARTLRDRPDQDLIERAQAHGIALVVGSDAHLGLELGRATMEMEPFSNPAEFLRSVQSATPLFSRSPLWVHGVTKLIRPVRRLLARAHG